MTRRAPALEHFFPEAANLNHPERFPGTINLIVLVYAKVAFAAFQMQIARI